MQMRVGGGLVRSGNGFAPPSLEEVRLVITCHVIIS